MDEGKVRSFESRLMVLEAERNMEQLDGALRSYHRAGVLTGFAIACLVYALVIFLRGSNSEG